jgi:dolichol-phosphate mannosyltransferase/undecaprenyl-phosphate 4-deoxy-4-formamido-L-arabinose transferase
MKFSIVIPVYNTVNPLHELVDGIKRVFQEIGYEFEIIMVEDCSPNSGTWEMLESIARKNPEVTAIQLSRNFGQQPATLCGLAEASGDFMITMDDDLQHSPEDIPRLIEQNQHDIVIGQFSEKKHSLFKRIASKVKSYFDTILIGKPNNVRLSPFRMINRTTVNGMLAINTPNPFIPALMFHVSKDVVGVTFEHHYRREGKSNYTFLKMLGVFNNLIIGNSSFLLKTIGYLGIVIALISLIYASVIVFGQLINPSTIPGWTSVIVSILFVGGLLLFSVGIIGEYLIRIIAGVESRPSYVVRKKINLSE